MLMLPHVSDAATAEYESLSASDRASLGSWVVMLGDKLRKATAQWMADHPEEADAWMADLKAAGEKWCGDLPGGCSTGWHSNAIEARKIAEDKANTKGGLTMRDAIAAATGAAAGFLVFKMFRR
jgi:ABC-type proline/glycine betaine transport system substrate-binding protein